MMGHHQWPGVALQETVHPYLIHVTVRASSTDARGVGICMREEVLCYNTPETVRQFRARVTRV